MADKDITIGIKTTGGSTAAAEIGKVDKALEGVATEANRTAASVDKVADSTKQLGTTGYGSKGSAGTAALELSRAFEDAQYGIRGVLNNIPSLIFALGGGAGLAGAISIAAVAGSQLWSRLGGGAKKAEEETRDYLEVFKQIADTYSEINKSAEEAIDKAGNERAENLKRTIQGIDRGVTIQTEAAGLEEARVKAEAALALVQNRIRLAEVEKSIAVATGADALRLAQEREAVVQRIYETEMKIADASREQALATAQAKLSGAQSTANARAGASRDVTAQLSELKGAQEAFYSDYERLNTARQQEASAIREEIKASEAARDARVKDAARNGADVGAQLAIVSVFNQQIDKLVARLDKVAEPSGAEFDALAQAQALQPQLDALEAQAKVAAEAQQEASRAMQEAARALLNLQQGQDIARRSEVEIKATEEIGKVGQDISQLAREAIAAIQANAASQGRAVNPGEQEAIGRAQQLLTDTTPDAQQGGQLAGILQSLSNNLTARDQNLSNGIDRIINATKTAASKYQGLADRIAELQTQINQLK